MIDYYETRSQLSQHFVIESFDACRKLFTVAGTHGFSSQHQFKTIPIKLYETTHAIVEIQEQNGLIRTYKDVLNKYKLSGRYGRLMINVKFKL